MNVNTPQFPLWNTEITPAAKGALHEAVATAWLMARGYEVFRNVSPSGPIDMVAVKGHEMIMVDVKTASINPGKNGESYYAVARPTPYQYEMGIKLLIAYNGQILGWRDDVAKEDKAESILPDETIWKIYQTDGDKYEIAEQFNVTPWIVTAIKTRRNARFKKLIPFGSPRGSFPNKVKLKTAL